MAAPPPPPRGLTGDLATCIVDEADQNGFPGGAVYRLVLRGACLALDRWAHDHGQMNFAPAPGDTEPEKVIKATLQAYTSGSVVFAFSVLQYLKELAITQGAAAPGTTITPFVVDTIRGSVDPAMLAAIETGMVDLKRIRDRNTADELFVDATQPAKAPRLRFMAVVARGTQGGWERAEYDMEMLTGHHLEAMTRILLYFAASYVPRGHNVVAELAQLFPAPDIDPPILDWPMTVLVCPPHPGGLEPRARLVMLHMLAVRLREGVGAGFGRAAVQLGDDPILAFLLETGLAMAYRSIVRRNVFPFTTPPTYSRAAGPSVGAANDPEPWRQINGAYAHLGVGWPHGLATTLAEVDRFSDAHMQAMYDDMQRFGADRVLWSQAEVGALGAEVPPPVGAPTTVTTFWAGNRNADDPNGHYTAVRYYLRNHVLVPAAVAAPAAAPAVPAPVAAPAAAPAVPAPAAPAPVHLPPRGFLPRP